MVEIGRASAAKSHSDFPPLSRQDEAQNHSSASADKCAIDPKEQKFQGEHCWYQNPETPKAEIYNRVTGKTKKRL
jgi:hypothetical protein